MDKKQKAVIVSPKPLLLEAGNPSSEEKAVSPLENANPSSEEMNTQANSSKSSSKRKKRERSAPVRRSQRLLNATTPARNEDSKHLTEHFNISPDTDREDEPSASEEDNQPEPKHDASDMLEDIERLYEVFQEQQDKIEALKSMVMNDDVYAAANVSYKNLYLDCQQKVEALQEEKRHLDLELENALTKIELYEKGTQVFTEALDKLKDVIISASNLSEAGGQEAKYPSSKKKRTGK